MTAKEIDWTRFGTIAAVLGFFVIFGCVAITSFPQLAGADQSYVVLSDSMSPAIEAGAVVLVNDISADRIKTGDIITYVDGRNDDKTVRITHRVIDVEVQDSQLFFRTKGDANEQPDPKLISASKVVGIVQFHLPLFGFVVTFAKSKAGIALLIVLPSLSLIGFEVRDLYHAHIRNDSKISDTADDGSG